MANAFVILPDDAANTGKKVQNFSNTISAQTVYAQAVALVTSAGVSIDPPSGTGISCLGNIDSGSADAGSPVKVGGVFNTTLPTLTNGDRGDAQLDVNGRLIVTDNNLSTVAQSLNVTNIANEVALALQGASTAAVKITGGTWTGTLIFEVQNDGTNWDAVVGFPVGGGPPVTTTTVNGAWVIPVAGCLNVRVRCSIVGANTATVTIVAGVGSSAVYAQVSGAVPSGSTDSGNPVKVGGVYNSTLPTFTNGQRGDIQLDAKGRQLSTVSGDVADAATDSGNPLKMGAVFLQNASLPAYTTGQRGTLQVDPAGTLKVGNSPLGTPIYATGTGTAAATNVTLTIPASKMGYLDGFDIDGEGPTSAGFVVVTVTGILGGTLTYNIGTGASNAPLSISKRFDPPLQASAVNTNIVVNVASLGTGSGGQSTNAFGHYV